MGRMPALLPCVADHEILPADAAFMARSSLDEVRYTGYRDMNLDLLTGQLLGLLGNRPAVRHVSCTTDDILAFLSDAGLQLTEVIHRYQRPEEAAAHARRLVAEGHRLVWAFPPQEGLCGDAGHVVPPGLWRDLNAKENLLGLAPPGTVPPQRMWPAGQIDGLRVSGPVFVKAAGGLSTGGGFLVRYCDSPEALSAALRWFSTRPGVAQVIIESEVRVTASWCVNIAVHDGGVSVAGAVEQLFSAPGRQSGSIVDPQQAMPASGFDLARAIGEAAGMRGFRGLAGIDIGIGPEQVPYAFDPNFRLTFSTAQALLHDSAALRSGLPVSLSVNEFVRTAMPDLLARLRGPVEDAWFVPTRLGDAALLPSAQGLSNVMGFVMGRNREDAIKRRDRLRSLAAS